MWRLVGLSPSLGSHLSEHKASLKFLRIYSFSAPHIYVVVSIFMPNSGSMDLMSVEFNFIVSLIFIFYLILRYTIR